VVVVVNVCVLVDMLVLVLVFGHERPP